MGELKEVAQGYDSRVHLLEGEKSPLIVKEYASLMATYGEQLTKEILRCYYRDTEKVQEFLQAHENPLNQSVVIDGKRYDLSYEVIPQGGMLLEGDANYRYTSKNNPMVASQSFVKGRNMRDLDLGRYSEEAHVESQDFMDDNSELAANIEAQMYKFESFINKELGLEFSLVEENIKPYIDEEKHKVHMVITDLAASLGKYFWTSPSTESERGPWQ